MHADAILVRREIINIKRSISRKKNKEKNLKRLINLEKSLRSSIKRKKWRKNNLPVLNYNPELPIVGKKDEIIETIKRNRVVIISGETGSGKTTQIPKFCLEAGRGIDGKIGCTQPRRIAAITVTGRIADELGEETGRSVGYKIRFSERSSDNSFIKIMTDGILLAETQKDPYLNEYDTIIVDEAHERSLNIDFIIGILKNLLKKRNNLKIIITSATIDTEKFSKYFENAPVIDVSGRMYPVDVRYSDPEFVEDELTHVEMAVDVVDKLFRETVSGDILIFMPTEQDILETRELIEGRKLPSVTVLILFARLSANEQSRVFSSVSGRKIVISTNVAETSLTITGIKYVIDTGLARILSYSPASRTTNLPVSPVSRSSADQRKGRCGRVENGVCIRLYTEDDYNSRPLFTQPEVLRANLAEVILRMIALKLGNISEFPFVDRPPLRSIRDGFEVLSELGAITGKNIKGEKRYSLTENGRLMSRIPIDPRLSRMLIEAEAEGCLKEVAVIVSALSIRDPRERPVEKAEQADRMHATFNDKSSDFVTLLNIWNSYHESKRNVKTTGKLKRFCRDHFVSFIRMREWCDIHTQISSILKEYGFNISKRKDVIEVNRKKEQGSEDFSDLYSAIHKSILSGYLSNIAEKKEKNFFRASKGREVMIFPGSGLFNKARSWIVAAEMVETSRLFARTVANIDSAWLEAIGKHICKYTYFEPRWERKRGEVRVCEQVTLFGHIIVRDRKVSYGKINPDEASEIFIRSALVEGDLNRSHVDRKFAFIGYNLKLVEDIRDMENRIRRRDILVSEEDLFQYYHERLKGIYDIRTLARFLKKKKDDDFLRMKRDDLLQYSPDNGELSLYPDNISIGNTAFPYEYNFEPGKKEDGVTVKIPVARASTVISESFEWIVPGLYKEKITALIKGLPKEYRKKLVPVADTADIISKEMTKFEGSLFSALGKFIFKKFGVDIPANAWSDELLPDHLKMRISITDSKGKELDSSRDGKIIGKYSSGEKGKYNFFNAELDILKKKWERTGIKDWDFPDLPERIEIKVKGGTDIIVWPGLEKNTKGEKNVSLRLFENMEQGIKSHDEGVSVIFEIVFSKDLKFLKKNLTLPRESAVMAGIFGGAKKIEKILFENIKKSLFCRNIRTENDFVAHAEAIAPGIHNKGQSLLDMVIKIIKACYKTETRINKHGKTCVGNVRLSGFLSGLNDDMHKLVPDNFIEIYNIDRMQHIIRYVKGIELRAERGIIDIEKDRLKAKGVILFTSSLDRVINELSPFSSTEKRAEVEDFFWLIEEYKISVFAQELKTAYPVSAKRLDERLKEIERMA
ncbi:MAG: ATP-dependent RNA helicase HrpA [Desulfobacterales bacterium]|nr:ATP-dependent RNA helicase HrpA [Desulfobacterales bacterium]